MIVVGYETHDNYTRVGLFNDTNEYIIDDHFKISQAKSYSILNNRNQIICLHNITSDGAKVTIMDEKISRVDDVTFDTTEIDNYRYSFPNFSMIKGGKELIKYNFNTKTYTYCKLGGPLSMIQKGRQNELTYKCLIDLGKYFVKSTITFDEAMKYDMTMEVNMTYIVKKKLPSEKLINLLPEAPVYFSKEKHMSYLLHFVNNIVACSQSNDEFIQRKKGRFEVDEVLWHPKFGMILYRSDNKRVILIETPLELHNRRSHSVIYETQDVINYIKICEENGKTVFYIADEKKVLKRGEINEKSRKMDINITEEFYVSRDYTGETDFLVKSNMIYQGFEGILMQDVHNKNKDVLTNFKLQFKKSRPINSPISSDNTIMFLTENKDLNERKQAVIMPLFSDPQYSVMNSFFSSEITAEFLFYSNSLNEEFIVYLRQNSNDNYLSFDFYRFNGEYVFTKKHKIPGVKRGQYNQVPIKLSPNGKYLSYFQQYNAPIYDSDDYSEGDSDYDQEQYDSRFNDSQTYSRFDRTELHEGGESSSGSQESSSISSGVTPSSISSSGSKDPGASSSSAQSASGASSSYVQHTSTEKRYSSFKKSSKQGDISPEDLQSTHLPKKPTVQEGNFDGTNLVEEHKVIDLNSPEGRMISQSMRSTGPQNKGGEYVNLRSVNFQDEKSKFYTNGPRIDAKVFELVLLRRGSEMKKIFDHSDKLRVNNKNLKADQLRNKF